MPCFRGIELFFATRATNQKIPEFPHPDSSSVRVLGGADLKKPVVPRSFTVPNGIPRSDSVKKVNPTTSVYIPSVPGSTFAVAYDVRQAPSDPSKFLFFRLFVNGRPVAAWGIDPEKKPNGFVTRSFWAPCERFQDRAGIEGRNFTFMPGLERKSIAEDGGLIEVQVYRARDRKARAPRLDPFRSQDKYRILTPSVGLVEQPQELLFYEWHLIDAKDSPFASFRFHYRSWESLELLNLIPNSELDLTPKARTLPSPPTESSIGTESTQSWRQYQDEKYGVDIDTIDGSIHARYRKREEQRRKAGNTGRDDERQGPLLNTTLRPTPSLTKRHPQPSKANRDPYIITPEYLQRPLPELPLPELPKKETAFIDVSRRVSVKSTAPSVTPSLMQYVDQDSSDDEEIETGVALAVPITLSGSMNSMVSVGNVSMDEKPHSDTASSEYDASPPSTRKDSVSSQDLLSPGNYIPTSASAIELGVPSFSRPRPRDTVGRAALELRQAHRVGNIVYEEDRILKIGGLRLSESEWMRRTPSPVRDKEGDPVPRG